MQLITQLSQSIIYIEIYRTKFSWILCEKVWIRNGMNFNTSIFALYFVTSELKN